jgi:hypothetical protein
LRLGIGWRLGLGLAAVSAVLVLGEMLATRTAREALEAVRSMQHEHEPLANSANGVLEKLIAYDRAVGEYVQAHSAADDLSSISVAGDALEAAVAEYFNSAPPSAVTPAAGSLRQQLTRHIASARQLAAQAAQRERWEARRRSDLDHVYQRIVSAGGSGLAINGTQVVAERSLAELHTAINAVRGNFAPPLVIAQREHEFTAMLDAHAAEFEASPGAPGSRSCGRILRRPRDSGAPSRATTRRAGRCGTACARTAPPSPSACSGSCSCPRVRDCCRRRSTRPPRPRKPSTR